MFASFLALNSQSTNNLLLITVLCGLLLVIVSLVLMYFRQERINSELRLRVGDIEWLQLSEYHKNFKPSVGKSISNTNKVDNNENLSADLNNLEKEIEDTNKILKDIIDTEQEDVNSEMILQMINKYEDNTVLDNNLENIISTSSFKKEEDNDEADILDKDIDMKNIEETIMNTIENHDELSNDTQSLNNTVSTSPDSEWIEESYTMNELRDICKNNNIQPKGTKKQVIKTLLDRNIEIPKKSTQSYLSK